MPQLGESMAEATIVAINVQAGDKVTADQEIIEVETDKAVMGVTTPCPGEIAKIDAEVKGTYVVGAVLGYIEASEADAARFVKRAPEPPKGDVRRKFPGATARATKLRARRTARISKSMQPGCRRWLLVRISRWIKAACCLFPPARKAPAISRRVFAHGWQSCN